MDVTVQGVGSGRTADAVRQRSRDVYERLLDRIEERVDSADTFTLAELSQAANVAGRIGLGGDEVRSGDIRIHIVRDALPQPDNRLLPAPPDAAPTSIYRRGDEAVDEPPRGVSDDATTRYVDDGDA